MKQYLILPIIFLLGTSSFAQNSSDKTDVNEELVLPNNRPALNDLFEETKQKTIEAENKIKTLNKYSQSLVEYRKRVSDFEPSKIDAIFNALNSAVSAGKPDDILFQETSLSSYFAPLYYSYRRSAFSDEEENPSSSSFTGNITDALKLIISNQVLNVIRNNYNFSDNPKPTIDRDKFESLKRDITVASLNEVKTKLLSAVDGEISLNTKNTDGATKELKNIKSTRTKILEKLNEQETQINDLAIKLGLPLFCLTILLLFLVPSFVKTNVTLTNPTNSQNSLVEISTVLLLTMTILILGLSGKIQGDVLGTLIGGISGYVLNRITTRSDTQTPAK
jgi:hypothetical protein